MTMHMLEYFTLDRTVDFLRNCLSQGINTWQANYNVKVRDALQILRDEGDDINIISLSTPQIADNDNGWAKMLALQPIGVMPTWSGSSAERQAR